ncbi:DUF721 domain-containing protein [Bombella sp. ESL0385]|nr:DUF721 domain-containing protein [Bombella sp. ESL0385]
MGLVRYDEGGIMGQYMTEDSSEKKTKKADKTEYRRVGGRMIGALLPRLTQPIFRKKSPLYVRLLMEWETLVGTALAEVSEPCRLRPGVLTIRCCGPAAVEMQYAAPRILANINTACGLSGADALTQIKLLQDRPVQPKRKSSPRPKQCNGASVAVEGIDDESLKEVLERLGSHVLAKKQGVKRERRF